MDPIVPLRPEPPSVAPSARIVPTGRDDRGAPDTPGGRRRRPRPRHADEDAVTVAVDGVADPGAEPEVAPADRAHVDLSA